MYSKHGDAIVVVVAHIHYATVVYSQSTRVAELSWFFPMLSEGSDVFPLGGEHGDPMVVTFGDVNCVAGIHSYADWKVKSPTSLAFVSKCLQEHALGRKDLNEMKIACS